MREDDDDTVRRNRERQKEWYGEPLSERFRRVLTRLNLSQAALADVLGLSAPMLSQLISAQRAKISNPAVLARLVAVEEIAGDPTAPGWPAAELATRLATIRIQTPTTGSALRVTAAGDERPPPNHADPVTSIQALLRAVASAAEIEGAAGLLERAYPDLATVLRVYGNGRTADARAHYAAAFTRSQ